MRHEWVAAGQDAGMILAPFLKSAVACLASAVVAGGCGDSSPKQAAPAKARSCASQEEQGMEVGAGQVKVFLPKGASDAEVERIIARVEAMDGVKDVRRVSAAEARKKAEQVFDGEKDVPSIPADAFTDSIEVTPEDGADTRRIYETLARETDAC